MTLVRPGTFLALAGLLGMAVTTAAAQSTPAAGDAQKFRQVIGDWEVVCEQDKTGCRMTQQMISAKSKKPVVTILIGRDEKKRRAISIQTVQGIFLPEGVQLTIDDDQPVTLPFRTCLGEVCEAVIPLSDTLVSAMKGGTKGTVTLTPLNLQKANITMSPKGFTAAYKFLEQEP